MSYTHIQEKRGRWNSLDCITKALWSGSAALGGWIVDRYGYFSNFILTACLQSLTIIPLILVWKLEPWEGRTAKRDEQDASLHPCDKKSWEEEEEGETKEEGEEG